MIQTFRQHVVDLGLSIDDSDYLSLSHLLRNRMLIFDEKKVGFSRSCSVHRPCPGITNFLAIGRSAAQVKKERISGSARSSWSCRLSRSAAMPIARGSPQLAGTFVPHTDLALQPDAIIGSMILYILSREACRLPLR
jgi:hypothetical protein